MKSVGITSAEHNSARELVNNKHLTVFNNIVNVALHGAVCFKSLVYVVLNGKVFGVHKVIKSESSFGFLNTSFCKRCRFCLFIDKIIALFRNILGVNLIVKLFNLYHFKAFYKVVCKPVKVGWSVAYTWNYKRGSRFVYKNWVNLVNNGKGVASLHALRSVHNHIIAKIVKAHFVVCAEGYICGICFFALFVCFFVNDKPHGKTHKAIDFAHPFRVALCKIVVDRYYVHALARKRV